MSGDEKHRFDEPIGPLPPRDEVDEEIAQHLELLVQRFRAEGIDEAAARARAAERFGDAGVVREACVPLATRERRRLDLRTWAREFRDDVRLALRGLRRAPLFAAVAIVTLGTAIGANTAMFSVTDAVLLRALPYAHADRVAAIWNSYPNTGMPQAAVSPPEFAEFQEQLAAADAFAAIRPQALPLTGECGPAACEPQRAAALIASPNLFRLLGASPVLGRDFVDADGADGAPRVAIISHALWTSRFGSDPAIVGRAVTLGGNVHEVVGVMPRGIRFPDLPVGYVDEPTDVWVPFSWERQRTDSRGNQFLAVLVRARPGADVASLRAGLDVIESRFRREFADRYTGPAGWRLAEVPLRAQMTGDVRPALLLLSAIVLLVLFIACANVANLLLARGAARQVEMAVRAALGAGRGRIVRQLLAESVVLGAAASALGIAFAAVAVRIVRAFAPASLPHLTAVGVDARVLAFALGASLLTSVACGLIPALQLARLDLQQPLRGGSAAAGGVRASRRLRRGLVVAEVALTLVVLVSAGLVARTFLAAQRVETAFDPRGVLAFELSLPASAYPDGAAVIAFQQAFRQRLLAEPGVTGASAIYPLPLGGDGWSGSYYDYAKPPAPSGELPNAQYARAMPGYFGAMGIPLRVGREFTEDDLRGRTEVVVVNEELARRHWPGEDPIGKRVNILDQPDSLYSTVVGVVPNVRVAGIRDEAVPQIYMPMLQRPQRTVHYVVRGTVDPLMMLPRVRAVVRELNASLPVSRVTTMEELVRASIAAPRFNAMLLGAFSAVSLLLAAVGLYGVVSFLVLQRRRELGLRLALGSTPAAVTRLVVRDGMAMALAGIALGTGAAWLVARAMQGLLFGVSGGDPWTYVGVATLLAAVALLASWLPARQATRIDPVVTMRAD